MSAATGADLDWAGIGQAIREARVRLGMNQTQLADAAGLDRRTISNYENGRHPASARIPEGYYAVASVFDWPTGSVESKLGLPVRTQRTGRGPDIASPSLAQSPGDLFPWVGRFARAAVAAGGDPALRDQLEEVADRLLQSIASGGPTSAPAHRSYALAAYRPHAWDEGDVGVPDDDAERIQRFLDEQMRRQGGPQ
ncbi:helix-turn-helix transcriptional regulator [Kitasatospora sp. NPDC054939]